MAGDQCVIKQGYLHTWLRNDDKGKETWTPQFYVLHGASEKNAARLDWYDNQEQFIKNPGMRKALFIEEIKTIEQITVGPEEKKKYGSTAKHLFALQTYRQSHNCYVLKCGTEELAKEWLDHLKKLFSDVHLMGKIMRATVLEKSASDNIYNPQIMAASSFDVEVDDTAAAIHCELQGSYKLFLSHRHITLIDPHTSNPVITWPYKNIRRFGYSEKSLTIEGGSKCGIGVGLFIFKADEGKQLMAVINDRMRMCKEQSEEEYSYISFKEAAIPPDSPVTPPTGGNPPMKPDQPSPSRTSTLGKANSVDKPVPPKKAVKPSVGRLVGGESKSQESQVKMSEVLQHLSEKPTAKIQKEDEVYGYNHLNLKNMTPKVSQENENPYGEQLIEQLKRGGNPNDLAESEYAEIACNNNNN